MFTQIENDKELDACFAWLNATEETVADEHGWDIDDCHYASQTRSRYLTLSHEIIDENGEEDCKTLKIRISDHASAYCSEDISLARSSDDHSLLDLENALYVA